MARVNVTTGELCHTEVDFTLFGTIPIALQRYYRSRSSHVGTLGPCWEHSLEATLSLADGFVTVRTFPSSSILFQAPRPGERSFHNANTPQVYSLDLLDGFFVVRLPAGHIMYFDRRLQSHQQIPLRGIC